MLPRAIYANEIVDAVLESPSTVATDQDHSTSAFAVSADSSLHLFVLVLGPPDLDVRLPHTGMTVLDGSSRLGGVGPYMVSGSSGGGLG